MDPVLRHLTTTDFADLKGSKISGRLALSDDLINLGIKDLLDKLVPTNQNTNRPTAGVPAAPPKKQLPGPQDLLEKIKVDHLRYRTEKERTILEIEARVV